MDRYFAASYAGTLLWGLVVLLGLVGWGRLVARAIGGEAVQMAGWGLHAVWGMAAFIFLGGVLALFGACGELGIVLLICLGLAALIWTTVRGGLPTKATLAALPWIAWPAFLIVALKFASGVCWQATVNRCDDYIAYYNFCEKLLATGSFDDPLSWRRLASLGGHTLLQCSTLAKSSYANAQFFERGICPVILLGLVVGFRGGLVMRSPLGVLIALVALTVPILRVNTASHNTGLVMLVGLFATLDLLERSDARRRMWIVAGCVGAALCTLRAQDVAAAGATLGIFWLAGWIKDRLAPRQALLEAALWGGALFVALLPWMIMSFRSNGTPLFPLFQGGNNLAFNPQTLEGSLHEKMALTVQMIVEPTLLSLVLCLLAVPAWRYGVAARAVSIAAVLTTLMLGYGLSLSPDEMTLQRYVQPLILAAAIASLLCAAVSPRKQITAWVFGAIVVAVTIKLGGRELMRNYTALGHAGKIYMPYTKPTIADHREAQLLIPEGRRVAVCSDFPFLFDHARNPIWNIDLPHAASPAPQLPFRQPPEETSRYLRRIGVEYLIFVDASKSLELYNRAVWQKHAQGDVLLLRTQAPYFLDFFDTAERLAATETTLGKVGNLTVVQLKP
jgi:hypothetical protein